MISTLRHYSVRLWATVFFGGLISILFMPAWHRLFDTGFLLVPVIIILAAVFWGSGLLFNRWGKNTVDKMISEAAVWERAGMANEAEEAFRKAVAVFESFLLSPVFKKRQAPRLMSRLARFYSANAERDPASDDYIVSYLFYNPLDEEVAKSWLEAVTYQKEFTRRQHELAVHLGEAWPENPGIHQLLARFYLSARRTDFPALQSYRIAFNQEKERSGEMVAELATLLLGEGRSDRWALDIYLRAYRLNGPEPLLMQGIAACVHWVKPTHETRDLLKLAVGLVRAMDPQAVQAAVRRFNPPVPQTREIPVKEKRRIAFSGIPALFKALAEAVEWIGDWVLHMATFILRSLKNVKASRRSMIAVKWAMAALLTVAVGLLMVNTVSHVGKTSTPPPTPEETLPPVITDKFTIQVAAYFKQDDAERIVNTLKEKGLDAYWLMAKSDRKQWYQVRVSHFPTKADARTYGDKLKSQGIIDDFYVANYQQP